jgi:hypothetical protein
MNPPVERTISMLELFFTADASAVLHRHEIDSIQTALSALLNFEPRVVELYYGEKLSFLEIAQLLELNPVTISALHNRAITRLAALLKEMGIVGKRGRPKSVRMPRSRPATEQTPEPMCGTFAVNHGLPKMRGATPRETDCRRDALPL